MGQKKELPTLYFKSGTLYLLDQRLLPHQIEYRACKTVDEVAAAIKEMSVRGAPAIGISAAYGLVIAAQKALTDGLNSAQLQERLNSAATRISASRPTAVNLFWALKRMKKKLNACKEQSCEKICLLLEQEAAKILDEDIQNNQLIGQNGAALFTKKTGILTHCNAGALATGGYGTALGVIRAAHADNKVEEVYANETRPLLQGARLTAFELQQSDIPVTLVADSCAGYLMQQGKIGLVVVGADRIAINGDTANKIGTYSLAVLAAYHNIPFYVAAPLSTIDTSLNSGAEIIIEERDVSELTDICGVRIAPENIAVYNPAFDITPASLITAIITELGVTGSPDKDKIKKLFNS